jgi:hypothetical protein
VGKHIALQSSVGFDIQTRKEVPEEESDDAWSGKERSRKSNGNEEDLRRRMTSQGF